MAYWTTAIRLSFESPADANNAVGPLERLRDAGAKAAKGLKTGKGKQWVSATAGSDLPICSVGADLWLVFSGPTDWSFYAAKAIFDAPGGSNGTNWRSTRGNAAVVAEIKSKLSAQTAPPVLEVGVFSFWFESADWFDLPTLDNAPAQNAIGALRSRFPLAFPSVSNVMSAASPTSKSPVASKGGGRKPKQADPEATGDDIEGKAIARRGHDEIFKPAVEHALGNKCVVTGSSLVVEYAHIKPWPACTDHSHRVQGWNGLPLAVHIHRLFDAGLLAIDPYNGEVSVDRISENDRQALGLSQGLKVDLAVIEDPNRKRMLQWHLDNIYKPLALATSRVSSPTQTAGRNTRRRTTATTANATSSARQ